MREFHEKFSEEEQKEFTEMFTKPLLEEIANSSREEGVEAKLKHCGICITMEVEIISENNSETVRIIID